MLATGRRWAGQFAMGLVDGIAVLLVLLACTACAARPTPEICTSMKPVYFPDEAIVALRPYRAQREALAANNATWEQSCARH